MLLYEVTVNVDPEIADDFLAWLTRHVDEMRALEPIDDAWMYRSIEEDDGVVVFVSTYAMADHAAYRRYLEEFAPAMRGDGKTRFGDRFTATRRVLQAL